MSNFFIHFCLLQNLMFCEFYAHRFGSGGF